MDGFIVLVFVCTGPGLGMGWVVICFGILKGRAAETLWVRVCLSSIKMLSAQAASVAFKALLYEHTVVGIPMLMRYSTESTKMPSPDTMTISLNRSTRLCSAAMAAMSCLSAPDFPTAASTWQVPHDSCRWRTPDLSAATTMRSRSVMASHWLSAQRHQFASWTLPMLRPLMFSMSTKIRRRLSGRRVMMTPGYEFMRH